MCPEAHKPSKRACLIKPASLTAAISVLLHMTKQQRCFCIIFPSFLESSVCSGGHCECLFICVWRFLVEWRDGAALAVCSPGMLSLRGKQNPWPIEPTGSEKSVTNGCLLEKESPRCCTHCRHRPENETEGKDEVCYKHRCCEMVRGVSRYRKREEWTEIKARWEKLEKYWKKDKLEALNGKWIPRGVWSSPDWLFIRQSGLSLWTMLSA